MIKINKTCNQHESVKEIICTACNLPMQYQGKRGNDFVWQCFKCEAKFIGVKETDDFIDID